MMTAHRFEEGSAAAKAFELAIGAARAKYLANTAFLIAIVWAPTLGVKGADEASRAAVQHFDDPEGPPVAIAAVRVLEHRRKAFGLVIDDAAIDDLAMRAVRIWLARERAR